MDVALMVTNAGRSLIDRLASAALATAFNTELWSLAQ